MTTPTRTADQIANDHGCDLHVMPDGRTLLTVQSRWSQGDVADDRRIAETSHAIEAAGHRIRWYRFDPSRPAPLISAVEMPGRVRMPWESR